MSKTTGGFAPRLLLKICLQQATIVGGCDWKHTYNSCLSKTAYLQGMKNKRKKSKKRR